MLFCMWLLKCLIRKLVVWFVMFIYLLMRLLFMCVWKLLRFRLMFFIVVFSFVVK